MNIDRIDDTQNILATGEARTRIQRRATPSEAFSDQGPRTGPDAGDETRQSAALHRQADDEWWFGG